MILLAVSVLLATAPQMHVASAYSRGGGEVCVEVPDGLVDWRGLAIESIGVAQVDRPTKEFLREHSGDYGPSVELRLPPTAAARARRWNVLHETGVYRLQPEWLRVVVAYQVQEGGLALRSPTRFDGEVCGRAKRVVHAGFVISDEVEFLGEAKWGLDVIRPGLAPCSGAKDCSEKLKGRYTFLWSGHRYHYTSSSFLDVTRVSVFRRADGTILLLVLWADRDCDSPFSLFEVRGNDLTEVANNIYGCDV